MRRVFLTTLLALLLVGSSLLAFEAVGTLKKIDLEKERLFIQVGEKEHNARIAKDAKILGTDDKPLADGLKSKELKEGAAITITVEQEDGAPTIKAIRLGKRVVAQTFETPATVKKVDAEKGQLVVQVGGEERTLPIAGDAKVLGTDDKPLADGLKSKELKEGAGVTLRVAREESGPVIKAIRLGSRQPAPREFKEIGKPSVGLKPLTEMTATDRYKGEDGGLYGGGKNEPPPEHQAAAKKEAARIVPLDAAGKPASDGKIGLVSISMSNATQEYSLFKQIADRDPQKSSRVIVVDCAQGGQTMARWADPKAQCWQVADRRLEEAHVNPRQVQVAWIKLANAGPKGELNEHGKRLQEDTIAVLHNARAHFPNLRIAYLSSRIYGGWANTQLNPEPYAYEGAFPVRWLIRDQIKGDAKLNYDPARGAVKSPLLLWGPYLWTDGTTPRQSDGLVYNREDLGPDGTHPTQSGRQKVADLLLKFFKTDPFASTWFVKE
jgi:hypothetical protein